jgi:uncharacterized protein (TIGR02147 family)
MKQYQELLANHLSYRKRQNPRYSLRSFAKNLGMSPGQLSSLINGKKALTLKQAAKIIEKLDLDEDSSTEIIKDLVPDWKEASPEVRTLAEDEMAVVSQWYYFAILSLGKIKNNRATGEWIGRKLAIQPVIASEALKTLVRMNLIRLEGSGFRQTGVELTTKTDIPSAIIRGYHRQKLRMAEEKLETVQVSERSFASITFAANPHKLTEATKQIERFLRRISRTLEDDRATEVYTFATQLFPLTK